MNQLLDLAEDLTLAVLSGGAVMVLLRRHLLEFEHLAIREQDTQLENMVDRLAVDDAACAGRVIADHPAHIGAVGGGGIGREVETVFRQFRVEHIRTIPGCTLAQRSSTLTCKT